MQWIIATGNVHKVEEFESLLHGLPVELHSAEVCGGMPPVVEDGTSFVANAHKKAAALQRVAPPGAWILADDSGLEVDALEGAPGVYSARYAGPQASDAQNVAKLLDALQEVPVAERGARFRCVLCLIDPDGWVTHYAGACEGQIAKGSSGAAGFGYDPVFIPAGYRQSFAELGDVVKSQLSHRAQAVAAMRAVLEGSELADA
ncbi:MAG: RdgB/HAM1 family non-canonical purine NTP pyrophosphatase [Opitutales bacterium]